MWKWKDKKKIVFINKITLDRVIFGDIFNILLSSSPKEAENEWPKFGLVYIWVYMQKIKTQGLEIYTFNQNENDYISLTDIARYKNAEFTADVVKNWMRNRGTVSFLGIWEQINNPDFKLVEFDQFKMKLGTIVLFFPLKSGWKKPELSGLFLGRVTMVVLLPTKTLPLNLPRGFRLNSNFI